MMALVMCLSFQHQDPWKGPSAAEHTCMGCGGVVEADPRGMLVRLLS